MHVVVDREGLAEDGGCCWNQTKRNGPHVVFGAVFGPVAGAYGKYHRQARSYIPGPKPLAGDEVVDSPAAEH